MKNFFVKKILNKKLKVIKPISPVKIINSIGLLIDESDFNKKDDLIKALISKGIEKSTIEVLVFRDKFNKNEVFHYPTFSNKHLSWRGNFTEPVVNEFISEKFDLLISFYQIQKISLMLATQQSNASFKVGFSTIDNRLNDLVIMTQANNYTIFVDELFKYLKILKRL